MASNGVILLNLENRNAAEFQRLSVPDSYEKASGALTSGTYVTVYKWLYEGFMLAPSLCDAVDATDHINLVDRTNGGILSVYPDDTITLEGPSQPDDLIPLNIPSNGVYFPPEGKRGFSSVAVDIHPIPQPSQVVELNANSNGSWVAPFGYDGFNPVNVNVVPTPEELHFKAYHVYSGSIVDPYTIIVQRGHFVGTEFSTDWTPDDFVEDGEPITIAASSYSAKPYICEGVLAISYAAGWFLTSTDYAHEYGTLDQWSYFGPNTTLEQLDRDVSWSGKYYCANTGTPVEDSET